MFFYVKNMNMKVVYYVLKYIIVYIKQVKLLNMFILFLKCIMYRLNVFLVNGYIFLNFIYICIQQILVGDS